MKRRMITMLADQKTIPDFYAEISRGLDAIYENATSIMGHSKLLSDNKAYRGAEILAMAAEEEAAKFLILLDAVRCPKAQLTRQLKYAYCHLAKGIYVETSWWACSTFGELRSAVEDKCRKLYLDGDGEGGFWICENEIMRWREDKIYVDYVCWDDTGYQWSSPKTIEGIGFTSTWGEETRIFQTVRALQNIGITSPEALKLVRSIWKDVVINDDFSFLTFQTKNMQILRELDKLQLLKVNITDQSCHIVEKHWSYPLYPLDLREENVKRENLEKVAEEKEQHWLESII